MLLSRNQTYEQMWPDFFSCKVNEFSKTTSTNLDWVGVGGGDDLNVNYVYLF